MASSSSNFSTLVTSSYEALHQTLQTLWTTHFSTSSSQIAALSTTILALILTTTFLIRFRNKSPSLKTQSKSSQSQSKSQPTIKTNTKPLKNVFNVKQRPFTHTSTKKNNQTTDRPFGSSYYYAHNNPNATGGYRDGLRAEDYVMNGPRLLSRNGISVPRSIVQDDDDDNDADNVVDKDDANGTPEQTESNNNNEPRTNLTKSIHNSQPITRYLWDDDHDTTTTTNNNNIAKIYIDSLPGTTSTSPCIQWQTAGITKEDVSATLVGEDRRGLLVQIRRRRVGDETKEGEEQRYHLHVPRMYGEVESVRAIVKSKRLIVKLVKKGGGENGTHDNGGGGMMGSILSFFRSRSTNTTTMGKVKSWPQLASKETKGTAYDWGDYIDEDVFRNAGGDGDNGIFS